jgi:hypothetical protein
VLEQSFRLSNCLTLKDAETNTDLHKQFINLNLEQKKEQLNIQINSKAKQAVVHPSVKHSAKQSYRRYKSMTQITF